MRRAGRPVFLALYASGRLLERAAQVVAQLAYHLTAGLFRLEDVRRAIARRPEANGVIEFAEGYARSGLMGWETKFYTRWLRPEDRILLVGCGSGRDLLGLLEHGYRAEGLELLGERAAAARALLAARGFDAPVLGGSIESVALSGRWDAIVFSWLCYPQIPGARARSAVLGRAAAHLDPGGRILVSYAPVPAAPRRAAVALARASAWLARSDWRPEPGDVIWLSGSEGLVSYSHAHPPGTLQREARAAGLTIVFDEHGEVGTAVLAPAAPGAGGAGAAPTAARG